MTGIMSGLFGTDRKLFSGGDAESVCTSRRSSCREAREELNNSGEDVRPDILSAIVFSETFPAVWFSDCGQKDPTDGFSDVALRGEGRKSSFRFVRESSFIFFRVHLSVGHAVYFSYLVTDFALPFSALGRDGRVGARSYPIFGGRSCLPRKCVCTRIREWLLLYGW